MPTTYIKKKLTNKKILVTGVAGFIGSLLAKRLLNLGYKVVGFDNFVTGKKKNIPKGVEFHFVDCSNLKNLNRKNFNNIHTIYHLAGQSGGMVSFEDPIIDLKYNVESTVNLLELSIKNKIKNFFYASSVSVYGEKKNLKKVRETNVCKPLSFYGQGKLTSESYVELYKKYYKLNACSLRLFNTYGPGQDLKNLKQGMLSIYLSQAIYSKKIHVMGSLSRYRDFIHVSDVVDAFISLMKYKNFKSSYNVCCGKKTSIKKAIKLILKYLPFKVKVISKGNTPGDQYGIFGDNNLLRKKIKWNIKYKNIDQGIKNFVNSYLK